MLRRSTCSRSDKMFDLRRFPPVRPATQLLSAEDTVDESP
jgi:hypothetical protein